MIRNIQITYSVSITLLIVAGFGIYNILNMTIYNKMADIAILKAMGFSGRDVKRIFMIQSLVIGFRESRGTCHRLFAFICDLEGAFDGGGLHQSDHFPVSFDPKYYIIGVIFGGLLPLLPATCRRERHRDLIRSKY
jgi:lipoprotein-releasing system permease protein